MKIKSLLIFVFTLMSLTAFAQSGGIKGKVVSREGRVAVDGVKVSVTPGEMTATTDGRGGFVIENVEPGEYTLQFEAPEFEPLTLVVRVDKMVRDINLRRVRHRERQRCAVAAFVPFGFEGRF